MQKLTRLEVIQWIVHHRKSVYARLMQKVVKTDTCWNWTGSKIRTGYGNIQVGGHRGRSMLVNRVMAILRLGLADYPELCALHKCDNRACVNPDHLYLGTQQNNADDRLARGREPNRAGVCNGRSKLTEADVIHIRSIAKKGDISRIAREYSVRPSTIQRIVDGQAWRRI